MKVLAIGSSFMDDGTRYLHQISLSGSEPIKVVDLLIGGCSLRRHFANVMSDFKGYEMILNGMHSGFKVSIKEALLNDAWDVVVIQQASRESVDYDTYQPYLDVMAEYIRKHVPKAKLYLQELWAYEEGSRLLCEDMKYETPEAMLRDIRRACIKAAEDIKADGVIPSGEVMMELTKRGVEKIHRDTMHAHKGIGRYAIALSWYATLTGEDIMDNSFESLDEPVTAEQLQVAKECVRDTIAGFQKLREKMLEEEIGA